MYFFSFLAISNLTLIVLHSIFFNNFISTSPFDVYESFESSLCVNLRIASINTRPISNKSVGICDHIVDNKLDILCASEF